MLCRNNISQKRHLLHVAIACAFIQMASAAEDVLESQLLDYVGLAAEQVLNDLGEPLLRTPDQLWYRHEPKFTGGHPGVPNPAASSGRNGVIVDRAGGHYPPPSMSPDFCDVVVSLSRDGTVTATENHGPGCFEFIQRLRLRQAAPR